VPEDVLPAVGVAARLERHVADDAQEPLAEIRVCQSERSCALASPHKTLAHLRALAKRRASA